MALFSKLNLLYALGLCDDLALRWELESYFGGFIDRDSFTREMFVAPSWWGCQSILNNLSIIGLLIRDLEAAVCPNVTDIEVD